MHDTPREERDPDQTYGIIPPSGLYGLEWPAHPVITQGVHGSLSDAAWTEGNEGLPQQTFLGASIRSFSLNAGFGDSVSTLSVELVNDEFNVSDLTELGSGDDPYHNGSTGDQFSPQLLVLPCTLSLAQILPRLNRRIEERLIVARLRRYYWCS